MRLESDPQNQQHMSLSLEEKQKEKATCACAMYLNKGYCYHLGYKPTFYTDRVNA